MTVRFVSGLVLAVGLLCGTAASQPAEPPPIFDVFYPAANDQVKGDAFTAWGLCDPKVTEITVWIVDGKANIIGKKKAFVLNGIWSADFSGHAPSAGAGKRFMFADTGTKTSPSVEFVIR